MAPWDEVNQVRKALDSVSLPKFPRVVKTEFEFGVDGGGDPAVFVVIQLDEKTTEAEWVSANLDPIASVVRTAIFDSGVSRWPYVRFIKPSELNEAA